MNIRALAFAVLCSVTVLSPNLAKADHPLHINIMGRELSAILDGDRPGPLLPATGVIDDLALMEKQGLMKAELPVTPWSDTYWPTIYGGAAWRYADPAFPKDKDFKVNLSYFKQSFANYTTTLAAGTDIRSPAEKYDALVGDTKFALTNANWQVGLNRMKQSGKVLDWEGLCHGWAPASFSEEEPKTSVTVKAVSGELITFTPSDIKALTTLTYASGELASDLIGNKCHDDRPDENEIGRSVEMSCQDTNPATWHLTTVNRLGVAHQSLILDATFSGAVWNQPMYAYQYEYFNPVTLESTKSLAEAAVPVARLQRDKFKAFRAPGTAFVVGIDMVATYARENSPSTSASPLPTELFSVHYVYDLELNAEKKIIGGEWHSKDHPDFLWAPRPGARPRSEGEISLNLNEVWDTSQPISASLLQAAAISSPYDQPVYGIVKGLLQLSTKKPNVMGAR